MWYVLNGEAAAPIVTEPVAPLNAPVPFEIRMTIGGWPSLMPVAVATTVPPGSLLVAVMSAVAPAQLSVEQVPWSTYAKVIAPTDAPAFLPRAAAVLFRSS